MVGFTGLPDAHDLLLRGARIRGGALGATRPGGLKKNDVTGENDGFMEDISI